VCPTEALKLFGKEVSVEEAFEEVMRDKPYYLTSGGGVTVSGGEPLSQPEFTEAFLSRCHQEGIHTALDTCGYVPAHFLEATLTYTDLVLFDLKHMDSSKHAEGIGVGNELILDSAKRIVSMGVSMIARIPIIPGYNDSVENIRATASFVVSLKHVTKVDLLPYHRFGIGKYVMLDMPYHLDGLSPPQHEQVEKLRAIVLSYGLDCEIGG
jgi:pyruvate formate lyase activating enzyme